MIDWLSSMTQTYEFYEVDPGTWKDKRRITSILSCSVKRDLETTVLETATFETTEVMGECYIRVYLIPIQNGISYKVCLGTFMVQTPSISFDGKIRKISMDAYSPLLELKDVYPDLGYTVTKGRNIMDTVGLLTEQHMRAPVVRISGTENKLVNDFTANTDETWLDYLSALMSNASYYYMLDDLSRVLFEPKQDTASLQPKWTYNDDNSSILYPDIEDEYDLYGIPNVVEVIYSSGSTYLYKKVVNDNPDSPTSTVTRGREIVHRDTSPSVNGNPTQEYIDHYATQLLRDLNSIEHTITYSHGYCPVRIGDCVRLNYKRAQLIDVKAQVISQDIKCESGCVVSETAVYTENLWKED